MSDFNLRGTVKFGQEEKVFTDIPLTSINSRLYAINLSRMKIYELLMPFIGPKLNSVRFEIVQTNKQRELLCAELSWDNSKMSYGEFRRLLEKGNTAWRQLYTDSKGERMR